MRNTFLACLLLFIGVNVFSQNARGAADYKNISVSNPVFNFIKDEVGPEKKEIIWKILDLIDGIFGEFKSQQLQRNATKEEMVLFHNIMNEKIKPCTAGVELLSDGLSLDHPVRDCDTSCLIYVFASYEFQWEVSGVYFGFENGRAVHALLQVKVKPGDEYWFWETTCGRFIKNIETNSSYSEMTFGKSDINALFGNFYSIKADRLFLDQKYIDAINFYKKAVALHANMNRRGSVTYNLGITYGLIEDYCQAISCFRDYMMLNPDDILKGREAMLPCVVNSSIEYARKDEFQKALDVLAEGQKFIPNCYDLIKQTTIIEYMFSVASLRRGDYSEAKTHAQTAISILVEMGEIVSSDYENTVKLSAIIARRLGEQ